MIIKTKYFGEMDFAENEIIRFPEPLLGFEAYSEYVLLQFYDEPDSFFCLQSINNTDVAFILVDPVNVIENYTASLTPEDLKILEAGDDTFLDFYAIAVVREELGDSTVNLRCPIAVNSHPEKRVGKQLVMDDTSYSMRHPIYSDMQTGV